MRSHLFSTMQQKNKKTTPWCAFSEISKSHFCTSRSLVAFLKWDPHISFSDAKYIKKKKMCFERLRVLKKVIFFISQDFIFPRQSEQLKNPMGWSGEPCQGCQPFRLAYKNTLSLPPLQWAIWLKKDVYGDWMAYFTWLFFIFETMQGEVELATWRMRSLCQKKKKSQPDFCVVIGGWTLV